MARPWGTDREVGQRELSLSHQNLSRCCSLSWVGGQGLQVWLGGKASAKCSLTVPEQSQRLLLSTCIRACGSGVCVGGVCGVWGMWGVGVQGCVWGEGVGVGWCLQSPEPRKGGRGRIKGRVPGLRTVPTLQGEGQRTRKCQWLLSPMVSLQSPQPGPKPPNQQHHHLLEHPMCQPPGWQTG